MATGSSSDQPRRDFKGYGQFRVDLAERLKKPHVIKLATVFEFSEAEIGSLKAEEDSAPEFVNLLRDKGIIQEDSITLLTDALQRNALQGIADDIRRSFDKNVKSSQGVIDHMDFPYVSVSDFEEYKIDPDGLAFHNKMSEKKYKKIFENYSRDGNPSGLEGQPPQKDCVDHLRVVMIGKTGSGKSATANSLLGGEFFHHGDSARSVTESSGIATSEIGNGRRISVVDSPGLKDTIRTDEEVMGEIARVAYLLRDGVHAFLFAWNGSDCRFSEDDGDVISQLRREFKEEFFNHCLVVYSKADGSLKSKTLNAFIDEQNKHPKMKTFLDQIKWKVVARGQQQDRGPRREEEKPECIGRYD